MDTKAAVAADDVPRTPAPPMVLFVDPLFMRMPSAAFGPIKLASMRSPPLAVSKMPEPEKPAMFSASTAVLPALIVRPVALAPALLPFNSISGVPA